MPTRRMFGALAAAVVVLSVLAVVALPTQPAAASSYPVVKLAPNSTYEFDNPAILPPASYPLDALVGVTPADCEDDGAFAPLCDVFHVKLDVPADHFTSNKYFHSMNVELAWQGEDLILPTFGNVSTSAFGMTIWDDPIVEDEDEATECDINDPLINYYLCFVLGPSGGGKPGGDEPYFPLGGVGIPYFAPTSPLPAGLIPEKGSFSIVVFNYYGAPSPYNLKVGFYEVETDALIDLSIEEFTDLSGVGDVAPSTPLDLPSLDSGAAPDSGFDLGQLGDVRADSDLSAGLDDTIPGLDRSAADIIRGRGIRTVRTPGDETPVLVILWLVGLPLAGAAGAAWWFLRRRSSIFTT
jgi:hypothetical protein